MAGAGPVAVVGGAGKTGHAVRAALDVRGVASFAVGRREWDRLPDVLANRFGAWYRHGTDKSVSARVMAEGKAGKQRSRAGAMR